MTVKAQDLNNEIRNLLKQFKLTDIYEKYDGKILAAVDKNLVYIEFLHRLLKI